MCGIVGFMSDAENALANAMHGLKALEYRGYDSAGMAFFQQDKLTVCKAKGEVANLFAKLDSNIKSKLAIGHTRWATHGKPNDTNAHPHVVGDVVLVHNGIIENYKALLSEIDEEPVSQTDSEVIAHLINLEQGSLLQRVQKVLPRLEGSYALVVVSSKEPDKMVLACKQSPLVIGNCKKGAAVASDIYALVGHASSAIFMSDGETAEITSGRVKIFDSSGNPVRPELAGVVESIQHSNKGDFETYMHKEIHEQPRVIINSLNKNEDLMETFSYYPESKDIILTACGTSFNACLLAQLFFEKLNINCEAILASELRYRSGKLNDKTVIAVSQSGETADTIAVMHEASNRGSHVIAVVNREHCMMDRISDTNIYTYAGPEISVASTKSFTAQVVTLYMIGSALAQNDFLLADLIKLPRMVENILHRESDVRKIAQTMYYHNSAFFLGRLYGFPSAMEGALKLKEISYMHAEAYAAGEMKHGPIALISSGTPVMVMANDSDVYDKIISNVQEVKSRGASTIGVISKYDGGVFDHVLPIPKVPDYIAPILASIYWQLLAYHVADLRGCNIDKPRNLAKSVTVE